MTAYGGSKSHDAEIVLDFINENVIMDYSLNKFGSSHNSNSSVAVNSTYKKLSFFNKFLEYIIFIHKCFCYLPVILIMPLMTILIEKRIIVNQKFHYWYQRFLKFCCVGIHGITEQIKSGKLYEPILIFYIPHNVWFEYNLDGDYQNKIKSISLKRCFFTHYSFGKYPKQQQRGWNVIFEFTDIPQSGSCVLRHV
jgi:hypothetical protein